MLSQAKSSSLTDGLCHVRESCPERLAEGEVAGRFKEFTKPPPG